MKLAALTAAIFILSMTITCTSNAASVSTLRHREHRQINSLHARWGTVHFFAHHAPLLYRPRARAALRVAWVWIPILQRELRQTRAALHPQPRLSAWLRDAFLCIHRYEGSWTANTGNGYYGGLQMDLGFQQTYGRDFLLRFGTANNWPIWAQIETAVRAYNAGRGFAPWPATSRACGLR